jgi:hypothetical protein
MKLLETIGVAGVMSGLLITAALAGSMEARFDNTVMATSSIGSVTKVRYNRDNTLTVAVTTKEGTTTETKGTWRQDGANVCVTPEASFGPFMGGKESCVPLQGDKVGDSWETKATDAQGVEQTTTVMIVAGR